MKEKEKVLCMLWVLEGTNPGVVWRAKAGWAKAGYRMSKSSKSNWWRKELLWVKHIPRYCYVLFCQTIHASRPSSMQKITNPIYVVQSVLEVINEKTMHEEPMYEEWMYEEPIHEESIHKEKHFQNDNNVMLPKKANFAVSWHLCSVSRTVIFNGV